eukprot:1753038-Lingulodinium_polyedra.AAC.1
MRRLAASIRPCGGSKLIKRMCRSTLVAETVAMSKGTEYGSGIGAAIVDAKGLLDMSRWGESSGEHVSRVWTAD